jgi:hypothetical protein
MDLIHSEFMLLSMITTKFVSEARYQNLPPKTSLSKRAAIWTLYYTGKLYPEITNLKLSRVPLLLLLFDTATD